MPADVPARGLDLWLLILPAVALGAVALGVAAVIAAGLIAARRRRPDPTTVAARARTEAALRAAATAHAAEHAAHHPTGSLHLRRIYRREDA